MRPARAPAPDRARVPARRRPGGGERPAERDEAQAKVDGRSGAGRLGAGIAVGGRAAPFQRAVVGDGVPTRARRSRCCPSPGLVAGAAGRCTRSTASRAPALRVATAWRAFGPGMSPGRDVAELNANLDALGYGQRTRQATTSRRDRPAVEALQAAHGLDADRGAAARLGRVRARAGSGDERDAAIGAAVQPGPVLVDHLDPQGRRSRSTPRSRPHVRVGDPVVDHPARQLDHAREVSYVGTVATVPSKTRTAAVRDRRRSRSTSRRPIRRRPASRPGAGQRLDHDRQCRRRRWSCRSTRCWRSPAAATRSRVAAVGARRLVAVASACSTTRTGSSRSPDRVSGGAARRGAGRMRAGPSLWAHRRIVPAEDGGLPVLELDAVEKTLRVGRRRSRRCAGSASACGGRAARDRRAVRVGQVDAAARDGHARPADPGTVRSRGWRLPRCRIGSWRRCGRPGSGSCSSSSSSPSTRRALENVADGLLYAGVRSASGGRGRRGAGRGRAGRPAGGAADAAFRRRAAAGRDRAGAGRPAGDPARRRADRQPRQRRPAAILALFERLHADGATIVVITHDRELAARLPRQVELRDGRVVTDSGGEPRAGRE